jgi:uncharacterized protein YbjT (DUF2867 family)
MKPRCLFVTGASGYVGSRLVPRLLERGYEVRALTRRESRRKVPVGCRIIEGNPLDDGTFADQVQGADTFVQLVGVAKPAPWKGPAFRAIDLISAQASIKAALSAAVRHFIYVSVAQPAPVMKAYIAVRQSCEEAIRAARLPATFVRPWYVLGPGHQWPRILIPAYRIMSLLPSTREAATRLGLVTIDDMLAALIWAIEHPPSDVRVIDVAEILQLGKCSV